MASTVTVASDMAPSPRATVDIDDAELHVDCTEITVWQISKWGQVIVRGAERKNAGGGFVVTDYELPAGVDVTYSVEQFDADGSSLGHASISLSAEVTIPFGQVVIQDPLAPASAILVSAKTQFASMLNRSRPVRKYQAGSRTFAMSGLYSAFESVPLTVFTTTEDERESLAAILEQPLILVRTPPSMRLPGSFYAVVADVPQDASLAHYESEEDAWMLRADQVSRPDLEVIVPLITLQTIHDYLDQKYGAPSTLSDFATEWATLIDVLRNPPPYT